MRDTLKLKMHVLAFFVVLLSLSALGQTPAGPIPATFFGMNLNPSIPPTNYPTVSIGNMGKQAQAQWGYIEPNAPVGAGCPGTTNCTHTYNWTNLDAYSSAAASHSIPFQFTYDEAPPWATSNVGCSGSPSQCTGPLTDLPDFDAFITALATRYDGAHGHGLVSVYEIGNEMEGDYSGSVSQLATQTEHLVVAVHAANPSALIVGPGADDPHASYAFGSGGFFDQFWTAWGAIGGNHRHLDAITFHSYASGVALAFQGTCNTTVSEFGQTNQAGLVDCVKQAEARNGLTGTPIWDTEGSWGSANNTVLTIDQKEAYIGESLIWLWSLGVSRQNWYAWNNSSFGTLCTGGAPCTPNAAATAYQQVYNWMVGATMTSPCAASGTVWTCGLTLANGAPALAVWDTLGNSSYSPASEYVKYSDLAGNTSNISGPPTIGIKPVLFVSSTTSNLPSPPTGLTATVH
jgi:hypothetical protein